MRRNEFRAGFQFRRGRLASKGKLKCKGNAGAIVAGKYMAVQRILDQQRQAVRDVFGGPETYAAMKAAADAFRKNAEENPELFADEGDEEGFEEDGDEDVLAAVEGEAEAPEFPDTFEGFQEELQKSMDVDGMGLVFESLTWIDALFFGLAILTAVWRVVPDLPRPEGPSRHGLGAEAREVLALLIGRRLRAPVVLALVGYAALIGLRGLWAGPYLTDHLGFSLTGSGGVLAGLSAVMIAAPILFG